MPRVTYTTDNYVFSFWMSDMLEAESIAVAAAEHYCSNTSRTVSWPLSLSVHLDGKALGRFIVKHGPALVASQVFDLTSFEHGDLLPNCRCMTTAVESEEYASPEECTVRRSHRNWWTLVDSKGSAVLELDLDQDPDIILRQALEVLNRAYRAGFDAQRKVLMDWLDVDES